VGLATASPPVVAPEEPPLREATASESTDVTLQPAPQAPQPTPPPALGEPTAQSAVVTPLPPRRPPQRAQPLRPAAPPQLPQIDLPGTPPAATRANPLAGISVLVGAHESSLSERIDFLVEPCR
jgi:hypothetical protein